MRKNKKICLVLIILITIILVKWWEEVDTRYDPPFIIKHKLQKRYGKGFVVEKLVEETPHEKIYSVHRKDDKSIQFLVSTGWHDGYWDSLFPFIYEPEGSRDIYDTYYYACWRAKVAPILEEYGITDTFTSPLKEECKKPQPMPPANGLYSSDMKNKYCVIIDKEASLYEGSKIIYEIIQRINSTEPFSHFPVVENREEDDGVGLHNDHYAVFAKYKGKYVGFFIDYGYTESEIFERLLKYSVNAKDQSTDMDDIGAADSIRRTSK